MNKLIESIESTIKKLGIKSGDIVYVASDITRLLFLAADQYGVSEKEDRNIFLNELTDMLQKAVGEEGTLLFPVFTWSICRGKGFDLIHTKGEVGALSNWVMTKRKDFVRTKHAIYSFMVWGKKAEFLSRMDYQEGFGRASIFEYLRLNNAKQLDIDIEAYQGLTFAHFAEQCADVPYRHPKYFFGNYTDEMGVTDFRSYSMYVRDIDTDTGVKVTNDFLSEAGVLKEATIEDIRYSLIELTPCYEVLMKDITQNAGRNTIYFKKDGKLTGDVIDWSAPKTLPYELGKIN